MSTTQTYAVFSCNDSSADAETNFSASDVAYHIYHRDGGDYRLEAKMLTHRYDDEDNELPDIQDTTDSGDLVFEVWFKHNISFSWRKSQRVAIGRDEVEAEEAFLQDSFDRAMWNDSRWFVLTTEQYLAEEAEKVAQALAELNGE
jgi:hypothetical protein